MVGSSVTMQKAMRPSVRRFGVKTRNAPLVFRGLPVVRVVRPGALPPGYSFESGSTGTGTNVSAKSLMRNSRSRESRVPM